MEDIGRTKFNICIFGDTTVGKTSMIHVLTNQGFNESHLATIGIDYVLDHTKLGGKDYTVKIIDTSGQETFTNITAAQIRQGDGFILTYAINSKSSFEVLNKWVDRINSVYDISKYPIVIAGNKCDLEDKREVTFDEGEKYAQLRGFFFKETSAKTGVNIREIFDALYKKVYEKISKEDKKDSFEVNNNNTKTKKKGCC